MGTRLSRCITRFTMVTVILGSLAAPALAADQIVTDCSNDTELRSDWFAL